MDHAEEKYWLEAARASPVNYFSFKRQSIVMHSLGSRSPPPVHR